MNVAELEAMLSKITNKSLLVYWDGRRDFELVDRVGVKIYWLGPGDTEKSNVVILS